MTNYEIYVLILCVIVFLLLTSLSVICLAAIMRLTLKLIRSGLEDERILAEHRKKQDQKKASNIIRVVDYAFSGIVCLVLVVVFVCSFFVSCSENANAWEMPTAYRVVRTGSMAKMHPDNTYIRENRLDDQIQTFDMIRTEKLPDEMALELYDIVVYEVDDMLIIHRIVEIEEPNESHPDCRYFRLQGDAVESPDRFPVRYEQMRAIYRGDRTPFIGSLILFMQSPAGWLCIMLIVSAMIASPTLENLLEKEKYKRILLYITEAPAEEPVVEEPVEEPIVEIAPAPAPAPVTLPPKAVYTRSGKTCEVNIGVLDRYFESGDVVDITTLKQKKLIDRDAQKVKILSHGGITKPLTIRAHSFSPKAVSAIYAAGGYIVDLRGADNEEKIAADARAGDVHD